VLKDLLDVEIEGLAFGRERWCSRPGHGSKLAEVSFKKAFPP
jgi:hypothetical protein